MLFPFNIFGGYMAKQLKVIFLGGVGEIGKNMTAIEYGGNIVIVDCGSSFPTDETPGIDLLIPDFSYLIENKDKVRAILLTHGHEDHIGAMPFLLKEFPNVKVYGTLLTLKLMEHKVKEAHLPQPKTVVVKGGDREKISCFDVEFVKMSHSISGALAFSIKTPVGVIFHTGDFKIDYTPIDGDAVNFATLARIGDEGVLLMLGESTNVEREGYTMSERAVGATLEKIFQSHRDRRIIISTFASNVHRLQQIINVATRNKRKIVFSGRSMINISEMAKEIGELDYNPKDIIETDEISKHAPEKICVICTGSQGEPMSALTRMASGDDKIHITDKDTVVFSSSPIPGNERSVYNVINNLYRQGAKVLYGSLEELHVSGHACKEELKLMLSLIKPKFFIPVHGEYRHLKQHSELAMTLGVGKSNTLITDIGSVVEVKKKKLEKLSSVTAGNVYVDGLTVGDVDSMVLRDRRQLSKDGFVTVLISISLENEGLVGKPEIIARGIQFNDDNLEEMRDIIAKAFERFDYKGAEDRATFKASVRKQLNKFISLSLKQRPMILPIIMEI
jgi:ribonuclease J